MLAMQACPLDWLQSKGFVQEARIAAYSGGKGRIFISSRWRAGIGIGIAGKRYPIGILLQNGRRLSAGSQSRTRSPPRASPEAPRSSEATSQWDLRPSPAGNAGRISLLLTRCDVPDISTLWIEGRSLPNSRVAT